VRAVVGHLVDRYGIDQVRRWPIEVWNEPNLEAFWSAGQDAYHRLYEVTARAVKEVDAELQVGGPSLAPGYQDEWIERFAEFVDTVTCRSTSSAATPTPPVPSSPCRSAPTRPSCRRPPCWNSSAPPGGSWRAPGSPDCRSTSPSSTPPTARTTPSTTPR